MRMEQSCCASEKDGFAIECHETDEGYHIILKGDKDKIRACCEPYISGLGPKTSCC